MAYEVNYSHVINISINGIDFTLYFSKEKNKKLKDLFLDILVDNYKKRMQDYIENSPKMA